jgi:hypothetical protein
MVGNITFGATTPINLTGHNLVLTNNKLQEKTIFETVLTSMKLDLFQQINSLMP